jgi:tetratricopeptide (TPR) repeat protein
MNSIFLFTAINLLLGIALNRTKLSNPLSEDDGHWFYGAIFRKNRYFYHREADPLRNLHTQGFFGIHFCARLFCRIWPGEDLKALRWFKILWYAITAGAITVAATLLWGDARIGFIAGFLYNSFMALSHLTWSDLTYAEFFLPLPIAGALIALGIGGTWGWLLAGLLAGWAVQIKLTVLPIAILLPLPLIFHSGWINPTLFVGGGLFINLLPALLIAFSGTERKAHEVTVYFQAAFGPMFTAVKLLFGRPTTEAESYIAQRRNAPSGDPTKPNSLRAQWNTVLARFTVDWKPLGWVFVLALFQLLRYEPYAWLIFGSGIISVAILYVQRSYYLPKFGFIWFPAAMLAAKSIIDIRNAIAFDKRLLLAFGLFVLYYFFALSRRTTFEHRNATDLAGFNPPVQALHTLAKNMGDFLRTEGKSGQRLLVWGNFANIYLYSGLECMNPSQLFLYPNRIFQEAAVRRNFANFEPPEYIAFFNYHTRDNWTPEKIQDEFGIPYGVLKTFHASDDNGRPISLIQGIPLVFPILKRNDALYREVLIDRAIHHPEDARRHLEAALALNPTDPEILLRLNPEASLEDSPQVDYARRKLAGLRAFIEDRPDEAKAILDELMWIRQDDFRVLLTLSDIEFLHEDLRTAFQGLKRVIELNPFSAEAFNDLGVVLTVLKDEPNAKSCFERALKLLPGYPDALANLQNLQIAR